MKRKWTNIAGRVTVEVLFRRGQWDCPVELQEVIRRYFGRWYWRFTNWDRWFQVEIHFLSSGYYDPGVKLSAPEHCYPAEGDDERLLEVVVIVPDGGLANAIYLFHGDKSAQVIFEIYREEVQAVELDFPYDEREYDSDSEEGMKWPL